MKSSSEAALKRVAFRLPFTASWLSVDFTRFALSTLCIVTVDVRGCGSSACGPFTSTGAILLTHLAGNQTSSDETRWVTLMLVMDLGLSCKRTFTGPLGARCLLVSSSSWVAHRSSVKMSLTQYVAYIRHRVCWSVRSSAGRISRLIYLARCSANRRVSSLATSCTAGTMSSVSPRSHMAAATSTIRRVHLL